MILGIYRLLAILILPHSNDWVQNHSLLNSTDIVWADFTSALSDSFPFRFLVFVKKFYLQSITLWNVYSNLTLRDRNLQARDWSLQWPPRFRHHYCALWIVSFSQHNTYLYNNFLSIMIMNKSSICIFRPFLTLMIILLHF